MKLLGVVTHISTILSSFQFKVGLSSWFYRVNHGTILMQKFPLIVNDRRINKTFRYTWYERYVVKKIRKVKSPPLISVSGTDSSLRPKLSLVGQRWTIKTKKDKNTRQNSRVEGGPSSILIIRVDKKGGRNIILLRRDE